MDKLLEINPNAIDSKTVEDKGGQKLPDDAIADQVAKLAAASLRTTEPEVKNLTSNQDREPVCCVPLDCLTRTV
jgi:hypothetical protein